MSPLSNFTNQPIPRIVGANGEVFDDAGYDELPVKESREPMVDVQQFFADHGLYGAKFHPVYAGYDAVTGEKNPAEELPGTYGTRMFARESVAAGMAQSQKTFEKMNMGFVMTDLYRNPVTQSAGFVRTMIQKLQGAELGGGEKVSTSDFFRYGMIAKPFFSPLSVNKTSSSYEEFKNDLLANAEFVQELTSAVQAYNKENGKKFSFEDGLDLYVKFCVNIEASRKYYPQAPATGLNLSPGLDFENSTHPSGGSVDFLIHRDGHVATPAGFDFFEPEGGMFALENTTFEKLKERYCTHPDLRAHCKKQFNIEPEKLDQHHFDLMRGAMRALFHVTNATGATHYTDEFQHKQWGNIARDAATGRITHRGMWSVEYPNAGNSCRSIQTMTKGKTLAIYGGTFAQEDVLRQVA